MSTIQPIPKKPAVSVQKYKKQDPATLTRQEYDEICNSLDAAAAQHNQQGGQG